MTEADRYGLHKHDMTLYNHHNTNITLSSVHKQLWSMMKPLAKSVNHNYHIIGVKL